MKKLGQAFVLSLMLGLAGCSTQALRGQGSMDLGSAGEVVASSHVPVEEAQALPPPPPITAPAPAPAPVAPNPKPAEKDAMGPSSGQAVPYKLSPMPSRPVPSRPASASAPAPAQATGEKPAPASQLEAFAAIDRLVAKMAEASIAFQVPNSIKLKDSASVKLLLDLKKTPEELSQSLAVGNDTKAARVSVSRLMEARLSGNGFQVDAITAEVQPISSVLTTEWKWDVSPTSPGRHPLHLTLSAVFEVDGKSIRRTIRTFDETIEVQVTAGDQVKGFMEGNWQWLWSAILVPLAGLAWRRWGQG